MNVPRIVRRNDAWMRVRVQPFSTPRRSITTAECTAAVAVSHGRNEAFSTGSHAQYPPHPSSTYAHHIPRQIPIDRNNQESRVHLRIATSQSASRRFDNNADIANANGIVIEM